MQTAESVCLWNYQYKNNVSSSILKPSNLTCKEQLSCQNEIAHVYCTDCQKLQCIECEKKVHDDIKTKNHERLNLNEIDNELCSIDNQHRAIFYCLKCQSTFCYNCYETQHENNDRLEHKLEKNREEQRETIKNNNDDDEQKTKPIKIAKSSNVNKNEKSEPTSSSSFENVQVDENNSPTSNTKPNKPNSLPEQHNFNQQMLLESMIEDNENDQRNINLPQNAQLRKEFLLIDANEHLTVNSETEFFHSLKCNEDLRVKCVSIIGNTGDGKSYTLNQVFFNGEEIFHTSPTSDSCTNGIWTALDENTRTLLLDTEGRLGLSEHDQQRDRLLLKILCISDIVIYRTRASKLANDMFQFLSDASNAFKKYFRNELENLMKSCKINGSMSTMGPALIIFHETQYTDVLKDHLQYQKTAVEQLKERFEKMNLSYDAYSSIEYVGIQTKIGKSSDFSEIKAAINEKLENNNRRSRRPLSVIFRALKALNEKFSHKIPSSISSTLPDDFFSCQAKCISCGFKCTRAANHEKDNISHTCDKRCSYNKELDNEVWKCLPCHRDGRDTVVYGKLVTKNDGLVQGLIKYVWSGCVIECPYHGEIYRARKHWYGNTEPKDVTFVEIIHVWPDDDNSRLASDVTPRKFVELIAYAGSYLSAPTKLLTEMVADQVAPSYWVPNKYVIACSLCKLQFGSEFSKHHCRMCGHVFCDTCTSYRRVVPWVDNENPVRVCKSCNDNPKTRSVPETPKQLFKKSSDNGNSDDSASTVSSNDQLTDLCLTPTDIFDIEQPVDIPASRRVYETVKSGLEKIGVNYSLEFIKESTRPSYWKPDHECHACHICKREFNNTTNRLHHCRSCGDGVCENCSPHQRPVPDRDWLTPVRMYMYNGYSSYDSEIQRRTVCNSPLSNVPSSVAEEIVLPYLKHIQELITINRSFPVTLDKDFKWALEIFAFGFSSEESSIFQLCSNIYVEWLKVFEGVSGNSLSIPPILREKPEFYWSQMLWHLYHLFVIHEGKPADLLAKQMNTHKVLRHLQTVISQNELSLDLWHTLLQVFLAIGDTVLSPSYQTNEEHTAVPSYRLVPSIYQVFLVAVSKVHIPPGLWRTFRDYAVTWRHRPAVVYDWAQLTCALASSVVRKFWWPDLIPIQYNCTETDQSDYTQRTIDSLPLDILVITWIKFLTILQNPSECGDVSIFLRMPTYLNEIQRNPNLKLRDITSLRELPRIFANVTKAISLFIDIWLGKDIDLKSLYIPKSSSANSPALPMNDNTTPTANPLSTSRPFNQSVRVPPTALPVQQSASGTLKSTKSHGDSRRVSATSSQSQLTTPLSPTTVSSSTSAASSLPIIPPNQLERSSKFLRRNRPSVNSLMHLYGPWILDACLLQMKDRYTRSSTVVNANETSRLNGIDKALDTQGERLMDEAFAKSFATICTIFSSVHCDEYIHSEYLSRFYYVLQQGLRFYPGDEQRSQTIIESILLNSADLFRINLRGINVLIPLYLDAIERYVQTDFPAFLNNHVGLKSTTNLSIVRDRYSRIRFKCIQILMSIVSLPFHYENLQQNLFEDFLEKSQDVQITTKKFLDYRSKILPLLLMALHSEQNLNNAQLLFGTIRLACLLITKYERQVGRLEREMAAEYASNAILLICDKGTNDSQLFLASLDTIISFVTDSTCPIPNEIWKKVFQRLCSFIDTQLHLPATYHTREMHTTCVATYNALVILIIERPTLLDDTGNLYQLCEIIELGLSGAKAETSETIVYKNYKENRPASQRVAEAVEYLLSVLFEHKNINRLTNVSQHSVAGACLHAEIIGEMFNEEAVLHIKNDISRNSLDETTFTSLMASTQFKYFAVNGTNLFAMTELPIAANNSLPAIILLSRGLFGRNVWTLNFRYNPLSNNSIQKHKSHERMSNENDRSISSISSNASNEHKEKPILPHHTRNERAKSLYHPPELSIPTLSSIVKRDEDKLNLFRSFKTKQMKFEENAFQRTQKIDNKTIPECKPAGSQKHFESIRLFLSHYGFCSLDSMQCLLNGQQWNESRLMNRLQPSIQLLDSNTPSFIEDIKKLDKISTTLYCTAEIFYLKRNQCRISEAFSNTATPEQLNPSFLKLVSQFGSIVEIKRHCGWTGNVETSWKTVSLSQLHNGPTTKTLAQINGDDSIFYWVDLTTEMAFYLPQHFPVDNEKSDMRILIVWFEELQEDLDSILPAQEQQSKPRDISIIGIYPLKNRLFRILLNSNAQRMQSACASIPLIDGMVLPLHALPIFLRQAVNTLSRRKRLEDSQNSPSAYTIRKKRIAKIIDKYQRKSNSNIDNFFQNIFFSSATPKQQQQTIVTQSKPTSNSMITVQS